MARCFAVVQLVHRLSPQAYHPPRVCVEGGNITGWGEFKASDGLGVGCYTGDIYKIKPVDDTATTACVYPS